MVFIKFAIFALFVISTNVFAGEVAAPIAPAPLAAPAIGYTNTIPYNIPPFAGRADLVVRGLSAPAPLYAGPPQVAPIAAAPLAATPLAAAPGLYAPGLLSPAPLPYGGAPAFLNAAPGLLNGASPYAGLFAPGLYSGLSPALAYNGAFSPYAAALPGAPFVK